MLSKKQSSQFPNFTSTSSQSVETFFFFGHGFKGKMYHTYGIINYLRQLIYVRAYV